MVRRSGFNILDIDSVGTVRTGYMGILSQKTVENNREDADIGFSPKDILQQIIALDKKNQDYENSSFYKMQSTQKRLRSILGQVKRKILFRGGEANDQ